MSSKASTRKPTPEELAVQSAMDLAERAGVAEPTENETSVPDSDEIQIDPQMLQQATQMKNARLIATMVHENAMLEVALEQERRSSADWRSKYYALQAAFNA